MALNVLLEAMGQKIVGQKELQEKLVMALLLGQHILLEGLPGLAKTTAVKALAECSGLSFKRVQFTPDLMPSDLIGSQIYHPKNLDFELRKGPIFANLVIADEINRAPAKVQSALLEAMQEKQVSIGEETIPLPAPFVVLATQNPLDQEGTYPLPEAQVDRFLFKVIVTYPSRKEELEVMRQASLHNDQKTLRPVVDEKQIKDMSTQLRAVHVADELREYILNLVQATRDPGGFDLAKLSKYLRNGASPRASLGLELAAKAHAFINGRDYANPTDVKAIARDVLRHRILLSLEAEMEGVSSDVIIEELLSRVKISSQ